jgi:LysM domain
MRKHLMTAAVVSFLVPMTGWAQADDENTGDTAAVPEGGALVENPPSKAAAIPPKTGRESANAQHTVERGDTLWDLSQRYLGSPWYWPKVWSYNPEIANPHWIYPGNLVRFFQSGEDVPTQVEVGQPDAPDLEEGAMVEDDRVSVTGQIGYRPKNAINVALPGFVTSSEVEGGGQIFGSFAEANFLTLSDSIYVKFKKAPRLGETYMVFRPGIELFHPLTNDSVGFYTKVLGEVRVVRLEKGNVGVVRVTRQNDLILRTDLVGPSSEPILRQVAARPAEREIKDATVIAATTAYRPVMAEHDTIIIDRGSQHGVKAGNVFTIWRQHDGLPQLSVLNPTVIDEGVPREDVGQCVAMDVKKNATVCLVVRSLRELVRGDHAEVRLGNGARAGR